MRPFYTFSSVALIATFAMIGCNQSNEATTETPSDGTRTTAQTVSFANTKCPIMGGKPNPELTAEFGGKTVGFCCDGCPQKWTALSDEEKTAKLAKASGDAESHEGHKGDHAAHGDHS